MKTYNNPLPVGGLFKIAEHAGSYFRRSALPWGWGGMRGSPSPWGDYAERVIYRDRRSAAQVVTQRIPAWPGRSGPRGRQAARTAALGGAGDTGRHAVRVWDQERARVAGMAGKLERACGRRALPGVSDLEFLCGLGAHAAECSAECRAWLSWAVGCCGTLRDAYGALGGAWGRFPPGHAVALERARAAAEQRQASAPSG